MQSPIPPVPWDVSELPSPDPVYQTLSLFLALYLCFGLLLLALPDPWAKNVIRALLRQVWPFSWLNAWFRAQMK